MECPFADDVRLSESAFIKNEKASEIIDSTEDGEESSLNSDKGIFARSINTGKEAEIPPEKNQVAD